MSPTYSNTLFFHSFPTTSKIASIHIASIIWVEFYWKSVVLFLFEMLHVHLLMDRLDCPYGCTMVTIQYKFIYMAAISWIKRKTITHKQKHAFKSTLWLVILSRSRGTEYGLPAFQWPRQRSKGARSFRGQNILQPGHPDAFFSSQRLTTFLVVTLKTQRPPTPLRLFHCQNKTNKAVSRQIWYFFLFTLLPKQSRAIGRAEPGRWIFHPGHLTWRAMV